jgi:hypothetical protein
MVLGATVLGLGLGLLHFGTAGVAPTAFEPLLFMDLQDVADGVGLLEPVASTVVSSLLLRPPPLPYDTGALVIAVIESAVQTGTFEVYTENTTGWEPQYRTRSNMPPHSGLPAAVLPSVGASHNCTLLRFLTKDFVSYSEPHVALSVPGCAGTPTIKSIAATPNGGLCVPPPPPALPPALPPPAAHRRWLTSTAQTRV